MGRMNDDDGDDYDDDDENENEGCLSTHRGATLRRA